MNSWICMSGLTHHFFIQFLWSLLAQICRYLWGGRFVYSLLLCQECPYLVIFVLPVSNRLVVCFSFLLFISIRFVSQERLIWIISLVVLCLEFMTYFVILTISVGWMFVCGHHGCYQSVYFFFQRCLLFIFSWRFYPLLQNTMFLTCMGQ